VLRGVYKPPGSFDSNPTEKKLHLYLRGDSPSELNKASTILKSASATGVLNAACLNLMYTPTSMNTVPLSGNIPYQVMLKMPFCQISRRHLICIRLPPDTDAYLSSSYSANNSCRTFKSICREFSLYEPPSIQY